MGSSVESSFQNAIDTGKIKGAILCATDSAGRFNYAKALGNRTLQKGGTVPQRLEDIIYLASATKIVTTIAALQCVDAGLLTLDGDLAPIAHALSARDILTGFSEEDSDPEEGDGDGGGTPILEEQARPITLKMLLTHSSGLVYDFLNPSISKWRNKFDTDRDSNRKRDVEQAFKYPLAFQPGASWMYGPGLDWAGRIIEQVTGQRLGQYMQRRIFDPLGINSAQFYPVTRPDLRSRLVDLNPDDPNAFGRAVIGGSDGGNRHSRGDFGGHGLFISGEDFTKILRSILANDGKLLKPATVDTMFQQQLDEEASKGHNAALAGPKGDFFRVGIDPTTKAGHGLGGLLTLEDVDGWYGERTLTWGGGLTLTWFIDRKNDLCGVGAVQASLPRFGGRYDGQTVAALKNVFRHDIYFKHEQWKKQNHE